MTIQGASIFIDNFTTGRSHGHFVQSAAQSWGSSGQTYQVNHHEVVNGRAGMPHATAFVQLRDEFVATQLDEESARAEIDSFVAQAASGNVRLVTSHLAAVEAHGFENSVVNISQGVDALVLMDMLKRPLDSNSKLTPEQQKQYRANLEGALLEPGTPIDNAEQLLDSRLLQRVSNVLKESPQVQSAVAEWREGVRNFESAHNSVVVAAGNSGQAQKALARAGFPLDGSEDANLLAVPEVTTVGATMTTPSGDIILASASGFGPEVDIIASGQHGDRFGTSYSSPKVANALRAAHLLRPDFTSEQAESFIKDKLAETVELHGHSVGLLSDEKGAYLLAALQNKGLQG